MNVVHQRRRDERDALEGTAAEQVGLEVGRLTQLGPPGSPLVGDLIGRIMPPIYQKPKRARA